MDASVKVNVCESESECSDTDLPHLLLFCRSASTLYSTLFLFLVLFCRLHIEDYGYPIFRRASENQTVGAVSCLTIMLEETLPLKD